MAVTGVGEKGRSAAEIRKAKQRALVVRLVVAVVLPTVLSIVYYAFIASDEYESVASFTIRSAEGGGGPAGFELFIAAVPGSSGGRDAMLVEAFVESREMFEKLRAETDWSEHYQKEGDPFSRLAEDADSEEAFEYYRDHVKVEFDSTSGIVELTIRAYSAEKAQAFAQAIVAASEEMVNQLNVRARADRMELAQREIARAEERLRAARAALIAFQAETDEINPLEAATAIFQVRSQLEAELASARAELTALRYTHTANSPEIQAARRRIIALERQIENQSDRLSNGDEGLSTRIAAFEPLIVEKEFAQRAFQSALTALELARVESDRQHLYVIAIASPSAPDAATHPDEVRGVLTVAAYCFALLGVGSLLLASVREHANI